MKVPNFLLKSLLLSSSTLTKKLAKFSSLSSTHFQAQIPPQVSTCCTTRRALDFATALSFSSKTKNPFLGSQIHAQILMLGFSNCIFICNSVMWMYTRCQILDDALKLFYEMPERNLVSWTSMISGCIHNDEIEIGLLMYLEMIRSGFHPNEFTLAAALNACASLEAIRLGGSLHLVAFKLCMESNSFVGSSLMCMYANCGNIKAVEQVFESLVHRDLACWNAMAESYASNGYDHDAMRIVCLMHTKGIVADQYTFVSALKACTSIGKVNFGRQIHSFIFYNDRESNIGVMNSLMDMYFRNGMTETAKKVFNRIHGKDVISWNVLISGTAQEEDEEEIVALFSSLLNSSLKPNQVTFSVILRFCGLRENLTLGLQFFCFAYQFGFFHYSLVVNALINMFSRCGLMDTAHFLFNCNVNKSTVAYNEMILGYSINGFFIEALQLFSHLIKSGFRPDEFAYTTALSACYGTQQQKVCQQIHGNIIKSGFSSSSYLCSSLIKTYDRFCLVGSSFKVFQDAMILDLAIWGALISVFGRQGLGYETFLLLNSLRRQGWKPDDLIFCSILNACACNSMLNQCRSVHALVIKAGYELYFHVSSATIDSYSKCGDIKSARKAFNGASDGNDAIIFNTMITAYAHHGLVIEAMETLERMKLADIPPSHATFVALVSACSHLGLVKEGQLLFDSMSSTYGLMPSRDNFGCLIDLYARNGLLERSRDVIESMPYEPWPAAWRSLLSGCRIQGDWEMAKVASKQLQLLQSNDGGLALLSNICAEDGRWEEAEKVRRRMAEKGIQKAPGYSIADSF
ncbi:hypothetical protein HPP92_015426 [Vanilla planifolia]|uniref:Pentatricopeptide repeat-containing protein n=1 Tax=Vanilla planifolia TaxID=51239 RepID=A0A835QJ56_VANPL|nr:hypothetical protein HPP92_015426 [Vanilla planifolia]